VGCVIVNDGAVIGRGVHTYDGVKHAEVLALEDAGDRGRGATAYLNLEPCSHFGRTGPCADALIRAGISRVVCAMQDPNPAVSGQGFLRLRAQGVAVEVGILEREAKELNESFAKFIRRELPFGTLKTGMSLDSKIAAAAHQQRTRWITSEGARHHAHTLRHSHDCILVGINTVIIDDPSLTDRSGIPRRRPLVRIVVDRTLRTPLTSKLVASCSDDLLIVCEASCVDSQKAALLRNAGAEVLGVAPGPAFWPDLLANISARQYTSLLILAPRTSDIGKLHCRIGSCLCRQ